MMYLFKIILCSGLLYAFYHLILRNQRMFRFNRFFLLSIIVISVSIPFVTVHTSIVEVNNAVALPVGSEVNENVFLLEPSIQAKPLLTQLEIVLGIYSLIALFLITRLLFNLLTLRNYRNGGELTFYNGTKVILRPDTQRPFSFLNHIYTSQNGKLPLEILEHEKAHIDQKHSYDILFIELVICLFWFNPFLYLIRRAIKLNHEFLADESVLARNASLRHYQQVIINYSCEGQLLRPSLASHLSFGETKKRIEIMVKTRNKQFNILRQTMTLAMIITLFALLGKTEVIAQQAPPKPMASQPSLPEIIVQKVKEKQDVKQRKTSPRLRFPQVTLTPESKVRYTDSNGQQVEAIFKELSSQLQEDFKAGKVKGEISVSPPEKLILSSELLEEFKDVSKYRLRIDGNPNRNGVLNRFSVDDFHHYFKHLTSEEGEPEVYRIGLITNKLLSSIKQFDIKVSKVLWIPYTQN